MERKRGKDMMKGKCSFGGEPDYIRFTSDEYDVLMRLLERERSISGNIQAQVLEAEIAAAREQEFQDRIHVLEEQVSKLEGFGYKRRNIFDRRLNEERRFRRERRITKQIRRGDSTLIERRAGGRRASVRHYYGNMSDRRHPDNERT